MVDIRATDSLRILAGGSVSLLGISLLSVPVYDIWDDTTNLSWDLVPTLVENALFLMLAGLLAAGGVWLVKSDWETARVTAAAKRTLLATTAIATLMGWAAFLQIQTMNGLKPAVLGLNGVLVGAVTSFSMAISSVGLQEYRDQARTESSQKERLVALHETAAALKRATTRDEAVDCLNDGLAAVFGDDPVRIVVDDEVVLERVPGGETYTGRVETVPVADRGRIELLGEAVERRDVVVADLLATHLTSALGRIEREQRIHDERNVLEFINRTLRHDLQSDFTLVRARLRILDRSVTFQDPAHEDHLTVALDRVDKMTEFVTAMRTYMQSVMDDDHTLEPVALGPVVEKQLDDLRQKHPEADIENEGVPPVAVAADELLNRMVGNVLKNAVEHNDREKPHVVIGGERVDEGVRFSVADDGPGISADRREAVFEEGRRGTESDGTGFGLYLVKDVVESYGGTVRIRDNEPRGTVVELTMPVADGQ